MTAAVQRLPYFCDPNELPGPLPSLDEIEAADLTLPISCKLGEKRIVVVREKFVVKYGMSRWVSENEGHALLLLSKYSSIPAPRLYAMYREGDRLFLVMEMRQGVQLQKVWDQLSEDDKLEITGQLSDIFTRVRQIRSPGLFGNVIGGPLPHRFFLSTEPEPQINGPFHNERNFSMAMAIRSRKDKEGNGYQPRTSEFLERHLPTALVGHRSVFTHGDLQRNNILVSMKRAMPGIEAMEQRGRWRVTTVLDWEDAGWFPSYWEYAGCFINFSWNDDWPEWFEKIIDPYPSEAGLLRLVRRDLEF